MRYTAPVVEALQKISGAKDGLMVRPGEIEADLAAPTADAVCEALRVALLEKIAVRTRLFPFGVLRNAPRDARVLHLDVRKHVGVVEHSPADATVTVRCGTRWSALQEAVGAAGQWVPLDPPADAAMTVGEVIAKNEWGPRRAGYGTIREHLLGVRFALMGGQALKTGGAVVKSATGYDLHRLQVGALESLGVALEATLRLRAKPAAAATVLTHAPSVEAALERARALRALRATPAAMFALAMPPADPQAAPIVKLAARYEGHALAVDAAVEAACKAAEAWRVAEPEIAEQLLRDAREAGLEPGFRSVGAPSLTLRVACRPSRVDEVVRAVVDVLRRGDRKTWCCVHPSIAVADLWTTPRAGEDPLATLAEAAAAAAGRATVRLRRPFESHALELPRDAAPALKIMERLKNLADPMGLLNPGVLPYRRSANGHG